ncbi:MAG: hypothetical protein K2K04_06915 [Clostridia bacterium]|nr:hypothetical protein [Clostridia bacterium]
MILIMTASPFNSVYAAAPTYARANNKEAYFCKAMDEKSSVFAVPYTYCVEVLRDEGDWYYARYLNDFDVYKAVYGYCKKEHFDPEYGTPQNTFLYKKIKVSFSAEGNTPSTLPVLSEIALDAAYYGTYEAGGVYYSYVLCQGNFGYIEGKFDDYELNVPTPTPDDKPNGNGGSGAGLNFASIAFIVIASLSVVVILIIYFTTKKPRIDG